MAGVDKPHNSGARSVPGVELDPGVGKGVAAGPWSWLGVGSVPHTLRRKQGWSAAQARTAT